MLDGVTRTQVARFVPHRWRFAARRAWRALDRLSKGAPFRTLTPNPNPVLVVGNQKSGTSAIAGLLAKATGLPASIDLIGELIEPTVPRVISDELSLDAFLRHNDVDFLRAIIKDCHMTLLVGRLMEHIPDSKAVFVVRDPRDNIRSILNRIGIDGRRTWIPQEVWDRLGPGWRLVLDGQWLGVESNDVVVALAERWNRLVDEYLARPDQMMLARFEDFVVDRAAYIEELARNLALEPVHDIGNHVDIQFQRPGDRLVALGSFFGNERLALIESLCNERMKQLGYTTTGG